MISDLTRQQLAELAIDSQKPLVICDVDEVVVHFTSALESYLAQRQMWLDTSSFALNGNVRRTEINEPVADDVVARLIDDFFHDHTLELGVIDGAIVSLQTLARQCTVVMLTNLPHHARDKRINNLRSHGLHFPVVTNSGPKGPAIQHLAKTTNKAVVFIDDSPGFMRSARDHAPDVHLIHFIQDERFARHTHLDFVSLRTGRWDEALPHIQKLLSGI